MYSSCIALLAMGSRGWTEQYGTILRYVMSVRVLERDRAEGSEGREGTKVDGRRQCQGVR